MKIIPECSDVKRERGVCSIETGSCIVEDWTILLGNKTNLKDLQMCRNKWSKSILWRWNLTKTVEWRGKGIASGGIMSKQQKGMSKYFVSFGFPKYPHQCSLPSPHLPSWLFALCENWGSSGAAPYIESCDSGHGNCELSSHSSAKDKSKSHRRPFQCTMNCLLICKYNFCL